MSSRSPARRLLSPLTPVYRLALAVREFRLRRGWEPIRRLRFPVVSIGNLSTGGVGKTPLAIALARALTVRGFAVDVLSRGYGRNDSGAARVDPSGNPEEFGDEPLLIAREAGVPVYVARERYEAGLVAERLPSGAKALVDSGGLNGTTEVVPFQSNPSDFNGASGVVPFQNNPSNVHSQKPAKQVPFNDEDLSEDFAEEWNRSRVHILDDGFQHRQLHRDIDILLVNHQDWHDGLLPSGNLREPLKAALRADVIAIPESDTELESELRALGWKGPVWRVRRSMEIPQVAGPVLAFCGIARPAQFFFGLEAAGLRLADRIAFRDHHRYTPADLEHLRATARTAGAAALITTAKDYVRLAPLAASMHFESPILTAGLRMEIADENVALDWLASRLRATAGSLSL